MEKHNADDTKVLDSSAVIYKNKFGVWQFRYWLKNENKYIRRSLKTKVKDYITLQAEQFVGGFDGIVNLIKASVAVGIVPEDVFDNV